MTLDLDDLNAISTLIDARLAAALPAVSTAVNDHLDDTATGLPKIIGDIAALDIKLGTPDVSVSADIASVKTVLGTPDVSVSADIATLSDDLDNIFSTPPDVNVVTVKGTDNLDNLNDLFLNGYNQTDHTVQTNVIKISGGDSANADKLIDLLTTGWNGSTQVIRADVRRVADSDTAATALQLLMDAIPTFGPIDNDGTTSLFNISGGNSHVPVGSIILCVSGTLQGHFSVVQGNAGGVLTVQPSFPAPVDDSNVFAVVGRVPFSINEVKNAVFNEAADGGAGPSLITILGSPAVSISADIAALPVAVRDVNNANPAADSLGASINQMPNFVLNGNTDNPTGAGSLPSLVTLVNTLQTDLDAIDVDTIAVAVRDIDNTSPAANSLGLAINQAPNLVLDATTNNNTGPSIHDLLGTPDVSLAADIAAIPTAAAIATQVELQLLDEGDGQAVQQAIVDKIAASDLQLGDITVQGIAAAVRDVDNSSPVAGSLGEAARNADAKAAEIKDLIGTPDVSVSADIVGILDSALTETYPAVGEVPTLAQAILMSLARLTNFAISGTVISVKARDGSTQAFALTLDSATVPTSSVQA